MINELIIDGKRWWLERALPESNTELWLSNYWCADGDGVSLYIENDKSGFTLECFSGIPASKVWIDEVDFGTFQYAPNKIKELDFRRGTVEEGNDNFKRNSILIANYICGKFCRYEQQ